MKIYKIHMLLNILESRIAKKKFKQYVLTKLCFKFEVEIPVKFCANFCRRYSQK